MEFRTRRERRVALGLTQEELARQLATRLRVPVLGATIFRWEHGKVSTNTGALLDLGLEQMEEERHQEASA